MQPRLDRLTSMAMATMAMVTQRRIVLTKQNRSPQCLRPSKELSVSANKLPARGQPSANFAND